MPDLFRVEARESRRRKIYGQIRLWQSGVYRLYLGLTLAAIPALAGLAWMTPYTEKVRFTEILVPPGAQVATSERNNAVRVRVVTPFPVDLPPRTPLAMQINDTRSTAQYIVSAMVANEDLAPTAAQGGGKPDVALHLSPGRDDALIRALSERHRLQGTIMLPRSNIFKLLTGFVLHRQR